MPDRTAIETAILDFVEGAASAGVVIDVDSTAIQLSTEYPESGFLFEEICKLIENAAFERRAVILARGQQRSSGG